MSSLYRNYRPNNFSEVLGQNHVKLTLQNEIAKNNPGHSYLFCGPRAVGKTTIARILAKALNCENRKEGDFEPCDKCDSCLSIKKGKNLDVMEIDAASNTGVDNVRENIISFSRLAPKDKYKVFIIDEVHMLSIPAFNALLKIMEEPPSYVVFVLCTTEVHKIPTTIISRCERFDFKKISSIEIVKKLKRISSEEGVDISDDILNSVALQSGGYLRDAESLLGQIFSLGGKKITQEQAELIIPKNNNKEALELIKFILEKNTTKAISLLNEIINSGISIKHFTSELINLSRKILLDKINPGLSDSLGMELEEEMEKKILEIIKITDISSLNMLINGFLSANYDNRSNLIPQLPLEMLIIEYCSSNFSISKDSVNNSISKIKTAPIINKTEEKKDNIEKKEEYNSVNKNKIINKNNFKKEQQGDNFSLDINSVLKKWPEFLLKIKNANHSLSFIMQSCQPGEIKDGNICLTFKYKFHQDRMNDENIKNIVCTCLNDVFQANIVFKSQIDENLSINHSEIEKEDIVENQSNQTKESNKGMLSSLLNTFGGEIVS